MKIIENLDYEQYLEFANKMNQQNVFHSLEWGKFRQKSGWDYEFLGFEENNELVAAAFIITKKLPKVNKKFAHITKGFILDYQNKDLIKEVTKHLNKYLKTRNVFAFRIDPEIKLHTIDRQRKIIDDGKNNYQLVEDLKNIGYKHLGYQDDFEGIFPRLTFINYLQEKPLEEMFDELYYKTRTNILTPIEKGVEIQYADVDKIDDFIELLRAKAKRDGILGQSKEYFVNLMETFNSVKEGSARLCFTYLNTEKYVESAQKIYLEIKAEYDELEATKLEENMSAKRLKKINNKQKNLKPKLDKSEKEISEAKRAYDQYPNGLYLTGSIYVVHENRAWFLFTGSNEEFKNTTPAYLNLWCMIEKLKNEGIEYLDLFGASGNVSEDGPHFGIYLFKNRFNGEFVEFIGEFDYVIDKKYYFFYKKIAPKMQTSRDNKILRFLLKIIGR